MVIFSKLGKWISNKQTNDYKEKLFHDNDNLKFGTATSFRFFQSVGNLPTRRGPALSETVFKNSFSMHLLIFARTVLTVGPL